MHRTGAQDVYANSIAVNLRRQRAGHAQQRVFCRGIRRLRGIALVADDRAHVDDRRAIGQPQDRHGAFAQHVRRVHVRFHHQIQLFVGGFFHRFDETNARIVHKHIQIGEMIVYRVRYAG